MSAQESTLWKGKGYWELGISLRQWNRIVDFAKRENPEQAADVYGVPTGAIEDAMAGRWHLLD